MKWTKGIRPDLTPAQLISGIPILAALGHAFGIFDLSSAQQDALRQAIDWAFVLVGGDALIRVGRNIAARGTTPAPLDPLDDLPDEDRPGFVDDHPQP